MIFIIHEGHELKARTMKSLKAWIRKKKVNVSINWKELSERGEAESACRRWYVAKVDGRKYLDVPFIYPCNWTRKGPKGGFLIRPIKYMEEYGL